MLYLSRPKKQKQNIHRQDAKKGSKRPKNGMNRQRGRVNVVYLQCFRYPRFFVVRLFFVFSPRLGA
jgi:hypothetical protein